jgi:hypothetical protein
MANDTSAQILELGVEWARAEQEGNTEVLDQISAAGFRLVGPFGFMLDKNPIARSLPLRGSGHNLIDLG